MPRLELIPSGQSLDAPRGTPLRNILFHQGVEFPCGGHGRCSGCRVRVIEGELPVTQTENNLLGAAATADGWRLACQGVVVENLKLQIDQWQMSILGDECPFEFQPRSGFGIAVDLGTTTIVAQLVELATGSVVTVTSALNSQAAHGSDLMSRIEFALQGGDTRLTGMVREQIGGMVADLTRNLSRRLTSIVIVGNTAMHHLFAGLSVEPLSQHPFNSPECGLRQFDSAELGWQIAGVTVSVLPCLGGFVGSDLLAGILATQLNESDEAIALIDLGTNGEIIIGNKDRIICASTAAGPAFEGARISMGMRAASGAISQVSLRNGSFECEVIGGGRARGICGSGLVDAVAAGIECGAIQANGRLNVGTALPVSGQVFLSQRDIRELQLAKGAIAAGLEILSANWGIRCADLKAVHLAGAFGNYISLQSARAIGLLPLPPQRVIASGNTALRGAKMALFLDDLHFKVLLRKVEHVCLNDHPDFQDLFVQCMSFPPVNSLTKAE